MIREWIKWIISLIYPQKCLICSKLIHYDMDLCDNCKDIIKPIFKIRRLEYFPGKFSLCISLFNYSGLIREAVCKFKFHGCMEIAKYFTHNVSHKNIEDLIKCKIDYVTCVPLSNERRKVRGYNQSECFARSLSEKIGIPYKDFLVKIFDNPPQHELSVNERVRNVCGMYRIINDSDIKGKNILICDDIITTGNTMKECIKTLKINGVNTVFCCTIASA